MGVYFVSGLPYSEDELYHYGILGQKWGVRRFQNEDRTWTEAGKIRYGSWGEKGPIERTFRRAASHLADKVARRHPWMLSEETLNKKIERAQLEKRYQDAIRATKTIGKGSQFVSDALRNIGNRLINTGLDVMSDNVKRDNLNRRALGDSQIRARADAAAELVKFKANVSRLKGSPAYDFATKLADKMDSTPGYVPTDDEMDALDSLVKLNSALGYGSSGKKK